MEEENFHNASLLCRICFNLGDYDIATYQVRIEEFKYDLRQIFNELSTLGTWEDDSCPSKICSQCTEDLGQCYLFLQKIRGADDKIKKMFINCNPESGDEISEADAYEIIECIEKDQEDDPVDEEKRIESDEEKRIESDEETEVLEEAQDQYSIDSSEMVTRPPKRKIPNKTPHFVLTENVTNILSNVQRLSPEEVEEEPEDETSIEPPAKTKKSEELNSFLITKFVPAQATMVQDALESSRDDGLVDAGPVNQIRMLDMAAVEVKASGKIEFKDEDDESNIENPNTMYLCQYCPRAFSTSHHLIMHQRKSHVCQFCMKGFTKVTDLYKHSREAHSHFNCAICKKDFSSNSNLRQHMKKIHFVELPAHVSLLSFTKKDNATAQE